ncbi:hypothetical protein WN51_08233 [Melipona quadrifasciata]|uniref:Uncharacterized protein n=1 Tax=Melipona quadrifasciata TaxID=166423 RepID=A0A0M8ZMX0_9HYME|nr:hypothetical protein WN51_08233 [Melipona quadrifasciata]
MLALTALAVAKFALEFILTFILFTGTSKPQNYHCCTQIFVKLSWRLNCQQLSMKDAVEPLAISA